MYRIIAVTATLAGIKGLDEVSQAQQSGKLFSVLDYPKCGHNKGVTTISWHHAGRFSVVPLCEVDLRVQGHYMMFE